MKSVLTILHMLIVCIWSREWKQKKTDAFHIEMSCKHLTVAKKLQVMFEWRPDHLSNIYCQFDDNRLKPMKNYRNLDCVCGDKWKTCGSFKVELCKWRFYSRNKLYQQFLHNRSMVFSWYWVFMNVGVPSFPCTKQAMIHWLLSRPANGKQKKRQIH